MKKIALALLLILMLSVSLLYGLSIHQVEAEANATIYIRADGSIEGTDKIQRVGDVYTLTDNISGGIQIQKSHIVLDGAGYRLQGDGNQNGITLSARDISNTTIKNLKLSSFNIGIVVMSSDNNKILENTITDSFRGLDLTASENNTVSGNYIANNNDGIALENMYNNIVENTITNNTNIGIFLYGAGYNNIIGNNITKNSRGILVHICYNNVIYHNNFLNNTNHVETDDSNGIWDNGEKGNYWSDYEDRYPDAKELDGSGVWDTPYVIDEDNQDNYPLMSSVVSPEFPDEEPLPTTLLVASIVLVAVVSLGLIVYFKKRKH
jgi:parallel beta-helix repeat protein